MRNFTENAKISLKSPITVLIIDEDPIERKKISSLLKRLELSVIEASTGKEALKILSDAELEIIIADILLPDTNGINILNHAMKNQPNINTVILVEKDSKKAVERILRHGADDYIDKPIRDNEFIQKIKRLIENRALKEKCGIIGRSDRIREILEIIHLIAPTNVSVFISGESGTGKEIVAKAIHENSLRKDYPFIPINCGALPEGVLESELFGHEKGAFTSADKQRAGRFEIADKGSLFLDEIGEMPFSAQVKLLRVLETGEFMRVGGSRVLHSDARIIAATNKNLEEEVAEGRFRKDLFYRLKIVTIEVPPLRARRDDIPLLARHFSSGIYREHDLPEHPISDSIIEALKKYDWPGNVRELRNILESMIILSPKQTLSMNNLPSQIKRGAMKSKNLPVRVEKSRDAVEREIIYKSILGLRADIAELKDLIIRSTSRNNEIMVETMEDWVETAGSRERTNSGEVHAHDEIPRNGLGSMAEMEKRLISESLQKFDGNRKKTARNLGIGERTLYRKLKEYNLV